MTRRELVASTAAAAAALAAPAPSSHNVQPWRVRVTGARDLSVAIDPARTLPERPPRATEGLAVTVHATCSRSHTPGLLAVVALLAAATPAGAADAGRSSPERAAFGLELDLLPSILSAADGQLGAGGNLWVGHDRLRLRAVGTQIFFPPGALTPTGFQDRELTVAAGIVDYFFSPGFEGPWVGAGLEYWWNTIGSPSGPATASWSSGVFTLGGGYVWKIWGNLYLNPWFAGHLLLSRPEVTLYGATWTPAPLSAEVSLKIGWFHWL